jgi:hypothetical protein
METKKDRIFTKLNTKFIDQREITCIILDHKTLSKLFGVERKERYFHLNMYDYLEEVQDDFIVSELSCSKPIIIPNNNLSCKYIRNHRIKRWRTIKFPNSIPMLYNYYATYHKLSKLSYPTIVHGYKPEQSDVITPNNEPAKPWIFDLAAGELTNEEQQKESIWSTIWTMFQGVKTTIVNTIIDSVSQFCHIITDYVQLVSSLINSVLTCVTNIAVLASTTTSTVIKALLTVNLITSLTTFVTTIANLVNKTQYKFNIDAATQTIPDLADDILGNFQLPTEDIIIPNAWDMLQWTKTIITALVTIILGGLGLSKIVPWRDLSSITSVVEGGKKMSETVSSLSKFVAEEMLGFNFDHDHPLCKELELLTEEGANLLSYAPYVYIQDASKLTRLRQFLPKLVVATTKKIDKESSHRYNTIRSLLVTQYKSLLELEKSVNIILQSKPRQQTIGIVFSGPPGHGKSEYAKYCGAKVNKALNYQQGVYSLNKKSDGFYEPYGGQAIGIYNEWMALRSDDPILKDLNLIVSTDPMNFEGAALDNKNQPCQLKVVFLTSNIDNPDLTRVLNDGAASAVWDRLYHIRVSDPLCKGRQQENNHRRPDFSHLKLELIKHGSATSFTKENITHETFYQRMIGRVITSEINFNNSLLKDPQSEQIHSEVNRRQDVLNSMLQYHSPYDIIQPNGLARDFFISRFQGLPGSGKSSAAEYIARTLSNVFSMPIQVSCSEKEFKPQDVPAIYVFDDWVEKPTTAQIYLEKMNMTHPRSIYFSTSNTVFKQYSNKTSPTWWMNHILNTYIFKGTSCIWDCTKTDLPDGVLRRIGLQDFVQLQGQNNVFNNSPVYQHTFNFRKNFLIYDAYNELITRDDIANMLFKHYVSYLDKPTDFMIVDGRPPIPVEPPVQIIADSQKHLIQCLRNPKQIMQAYLGKHSNVELKIHYNDLHSDGVSTTMINSWQVFEEETSDPIVMRSIFSRMCGIFGKLYPTKSFSVTCKEQQVTYYYVKGIGYIYNPNQTTTFDPISFEDDVVIIHRPSQNIRLTVGEFISARYFKEYSGNFDKLTLTEVVSLFKLIDELEVSDRIGPKFKRNLLVQYHRMKRSFSPTQLWIKANIMENPVFWVAIGLLSLTIIGGSMYGLIKLVRYYFQETQPVPEQPNAGLDDYSNDQQGARAIRRINKISFRPNNHDDYSGEARTRVLPKIQRIQRPNQDPQPNMLTELEKQNQTKSMLDHFSKRIANSYVKVWAHSGNCYGLVLNKDIVLTVSHLFTDKDDEVEVQSNGKRYTAQVIDIRRERDLAVLRVTDKHWVQHPNIRKYLLQERMVDQIHHGFFIRPGDRLEALSGVISYYHTSAYPMESPFNSNYKLSDRFILFTSVALENLHSFIKRGDCGFPLVVPYGNNEVKILAIHNALNQAEKSFFSSISQELYDSIFQSIQLQPNADVDMSLELVQLPEGHIGLMPVQFAEALEDVREDRQYPHYHDQLNIIGYNSKLHFKSKPATRHKCISVPGIKTPKMKIPAAFTMEHVLDSSALAHTQEGKPSPLFTQCLKYDYTVNSSIDENIFRTAVELVRTDFLTRYPRCRLLRLHEVLNGIGNEPLNPLDLQTSPGPLIKQIYKLQTKQSLFKRVDVNTLVINRENPAGEHVNLHYRQYMKYLDEYHIPPLMLSRDNPKVELITESKAQVGKVRLFNELDLAVNMVLKAYFGDLLSKIFMQNHKAPIRAGQNPFITSTFIAKQFREIDGTEVSTDFSAFDKQLHPWLIYAFCDIVASCMDIPNKDRDTIHIIYNAIADSLVNVVHTCNGVVYIVDRGNESGTFVTTMLNSVSVQILTYYTVVRKWKEIFGFTPTLSEIQQETRLAILGDDRTFKTSRALPIDMGDFVKDSFDFGLKCSPAKTESGMDFCSRAIIYDEVKHIAWPALKEESICAQIHWYASLTTEQIVSNLDNALFEAALHPKADLFDMILSDAITICNYYHIDLSQLAYHSRDIIRNRFYSYVLGDEEFDAISLHIGQESCIDISNEESSKTLNDTQRLAIKFSSDLDNQLNKIQLNIDIETLKNSEKCKIIQATNQLKQAMSDPKTNPVSALLEYCAKVGLHVEPNVYYEQAGTPHAPSFTCTLEFANHSVLGTGTTKKEAKKAAFAELYQIIVPAEPNMAPATNHDELDYGFSHKYMREAIVCHLEFAHEVSKIEKKDVFVLVQDKPCDLIPYMVNNSIRAEVDMKGNVYVLSKTAQNMDFEIMKTLYKSELGTHSCSQGITYGVYDITPNSQSNPATMPADASQNPGIMTNPQIPNPVPAIVAPAMAAAPQPTMGAYEVLADEETYNTSGPPNMMSAGAIAFDLKDLIYNQFIDCDTMFSFTDDAPDGTIIAQIPYDPASSFVNPYIKRYVESHERFSGDLLFRATLVGNQTFSGLVGMAWVPYAVKGNILKISEGMKYAYSATTVNEMWNRVFRLKDARQELFYRKVQDKSDIENRPHLIFFVMLNAQSPLREGITVRIRIASKLDHSFQVANPIIPDISAALDNQAQGGTFSLEKLVGMPLIPSILRPYEFGINTKFQILIDGSTWLPIIQGVSSDYLSSEFTVENQQGRTFTSHVNRKIKSFEIAAGGTKTWIIKNDSQGFKDNDAIYIDFSRALGIYSDCIFDCSKAGNRNGNLQTVPRLLQACAEYIRKEVNREDPIPEILKLYSQDSSEILGNKTMQPLYYIKFLTDGLTIPKLKWTEGKDDKCIAHDVNPKKVFSYVLYTQYGPILMHYYHIDRIDAVWLDEPIVVESNPLDIMKLITQIQNVTYVKDQPVALPSGWRHVALTCDLPYTYAAANVASSQQNHQSLISLIQYLNLTIANNECLEIVISDRDSSRIITTLRYMPDKANLVMNVGDDTIQYASSQRALDNMYIYSMTIVPRSSPFPLTRVSGNFLDNQLHPMILSRKLNFQ